MVARRLSIDFAPALTGWTERGGRSLPVFDGIVVCAEQAQGLRAAAATRLSELLAGKEAGAVGSLQLLPSDSDPEDIDQETDTQETDTQETDEESDDGQDASSDMGNYERARAEHIARNHDVLAQLGLGASAACRASSAPPAHCPQGVPSALDLASSPHTEGLVANDAGAFAEKPPRSLSHNQEGESVSHNQEGECVSHNQTHTPAGKCRSKVMDEVEVMDDKQMKEVLKAWATVSLRLLTWFASATSRCNLTAGCHRAEQAGEGAKDTGDTSLEPRHAALEKAVSIACILRQLCVLVGAPVVLLNLMHEHGNHTLQRAQQEGMASREHSDCFATLPHVPDRSTVDHICPTPDRSTVDHMCPTPDRCTVHLLTSCTREQGCTCQAVSTAKASFKQV